MDTIKLPPFSNVGAGNLATLVTEKLFGMSAHALDFVLTGFTTADIESFAIRCGGKTLVPNMTGAELQALNNYAGRDTGASILRVYFGNPEAHTAKGRHITDFDQSIYRESLEIEIQIGAGAVAPKIESWARVTPPKIALGLGFTPSDAAVLKAFIRTILNPAAAVVKAAFDIGFGSQAGAVVQRMAFFNSKLTSLEVKKSGVVIFEDIGQALNEQLQKDSFPARVPQAGMYVWDPTLDGISQAVTTVKPDGTRYSMEYLVTTSGADTIKVYAEVGTKLQLI